MNISITNMSFLLVMFFLLSQFSNANDTINTSHNIRYNQTLVSSNGVFELGFFSPGNSKNWYIGIWYKNITPKTVVWVANRENPLKKSTSAELKLTKKGLLVILSERDILWSSNNTGVAKNPVGQLLDSGNLVLRDENDDYLWQSFDYPTDTCLPGMVIGKNFVTGKEYQLSSWKNDEDPAPGDFSMQLDPSGYPQMLIKQGAITQCRTGPWNGAVFSGVPDGRNDKFEFTFALSKNGVYYNWKGNGSPVISKFTLKPNGIGQRRQWVDKLQEWVPDVNVPADNCDKYKLCGAYGSCRIGYFPLCGCLDRFVPKDPEGWKLADWSNGCIRRKPLDCEGGGDGFLKYSGIKLPEAQNSWHNESMTLEECEAKCLKNCNCTAYTTLNIIRGSGCLLWFEELVDIRVLYAGGQDLYIRMASSELGNAKKSEKLALSLVTIGVGVMGLSLLLYIWKKMKNARKRNKVGADILFSTGLVDARQHTVTRNKDLELPLFNLSTIKKATNNFSVKNKLGEGGYGPVYKGILEGGQAIAVKRLSKTSSQGLDEFKNEVICVAKLQHRNLVKLLGCCIQGDEKMLIYEYMSNKSLDFVLFNERNRMHLDWPKRFHIINGIARGLVYLHQDSRLRIIHRDLKASNILLDSEMNPKISDFGIAKRFKENQTEDKTGRVIGTYGYMPPEYAFHGRISIKSDIFSFGVLILEIVSGKRNNSFSNGDQHNNLLGHAWKLYREGRSIELADTYLQDMDNLSEVLRVIHVGLLCVQQHPDDRPTITSVVSMLGSEGLLPQVNCPGFYLESDTFTTESNNAKKVSNSTNYLTVTMTLGR